MRAEPGAFSEDGSRSRRRRVLWVVRDLPVSPKTVWGTGSTAENDEQIVSYCREMHQC